MSGPYPRTNHPSVMEHGVSDKPHLIGHPRFAFGKVIRCEHQSGVVRADIPYLPINFVECKWRDRM